MGKKPVLGLVGLFVGLTLSGCKGGSNNSTTGDTRSDPAPPLTTGPLGTQVAKPVNALTVDAPPAMKETMPAMRTEAPQRKPAALPKKNDGTIDIVDTVPEPLPPPPPAGKIELPGNPLPA